MQGTGQVCLVGGRVQGMTSLQAGQAETPYDVQRHVVSREERLCLQDQFAESIAVACRIEVQESLYPLLKLSCVLLGR